MKGRTIVIGGGVMGAAIAWHAARRSHPIEAPLVLLEKAQLAAGSSGRSGAILRQFYTDAPLATMARDALRVYSTLEGTTGRPIGFQRLGVLTIAGPADPSSLDLVARNTALLRALGIDARLLDAQGMRALVPGIEVANGSLGCHEPDGAGLDPARTVEAFAALAREAGASTRLGVRVDEIVVESGRVRGVRTADGPLDAERVVVAAGPWSGALLQRAGVELPLRVVRPPQQFLALPRTGPGASTPVHDPVADSVLDRFGIAPQRLPAPAHPVLLDLERGFYTRCEGHADRTRVGRMDHSQDADVADPDTVDEAVDPSFTAWACDAIARRLPAYREVAPTGTTVGLYTLTPDAQALIGPWPTIEGLYVVTGFSGHGFKLAPQVGEGVAQMLAGEPVTAFDAPFFEPGRFQRAGGAVRERAFGL